MDKYEIKEKLDKGHIQVRIVFEIIGSPETYVQKAMEGVIKKIKEESSSIFLNEEYGAPEKTGDGLWGTYCEAEMLLPDLYTLGWITFNFAPATIEIIKPGKFSFSDKEISDLFNDFLGHIHEMNTKHIEIKSLNKALQINMNAMTRNAVLVGLRDNKLTSAEIGKIIGIKGKDLEPVLEGMIKEGRIEKEKTKYKRVK